MEDQAFSLSHDLAPIPPPLPVWHWSSLMTRRVGGGGGGGAKSYDGEKAWSSVNHSILSRDCHIPYSTEMFGMTVAVTAKCKKRTEPIPGRERGHGVQCVQSWRREREGWSSWPSPAGSAGFASAQSSPGPTNTTKRLTLKNCQLKDTLRAGLGALLKDTTLSYQCFR